ncbi:MAG: hypothetical protein IK115_10105 [Lachnospiraceae bacterium]|nr:hypothetical protein [Lachnospiraceae bacterium]
MRFICFTAGEENPLFDRMFADLAGDSRVRMVSGLPRHSSALWKLHHKRGLNRKRPAPFRSVWSDKAFEAMVREEASASTGLCLLFNNFSLRFFEPSQLKHWKKDYGVKLVLCFIDRAVSWFSAEALMLTEHVDFDRIYSYSRPDAESMGWEFFDCYYSKAEAEGEGEESDLYFWGSDTGRRKMLEEIFLHVTGLGKKVRMGICYAQGDSPRLPGISYDEPREYEEILKDIAGAKVLLDIIDGKGGVSLRYHEAAAYGKKLISNNPEIKRMRLYDPCQMLYITSCSDIPASFFEEEAAIQPYSGEFSPLHWIDQLEKYFI